MLCKAAVVGHSTALTLCTFANSGFIMQTDKASSNPVMMPGTSEGIWIDHTKPKRGSTLVVDFESGGDSHPT